MRAVLKETLDRILGRGSAAVTVPAMDGVLRPNNRLEEAERLVEIEAPDNLTAGAGMLLFSSGNSVFSLSESFGPTPHSSFDVPVSALAIAGDGTLAVGLSDGRIVFSGGATARCALSALGGMPIRCPTALAFGDARTLFVCVGSAKHGPASWQRSLMERDSSGSVWKVDLDDGKAVQIAGRLGFPYGLLVEAPDRIVVSESWRHRLVRLHQSGKLDALLENLPGYPACLSPRPGGSWLSIMGPRSQLIEFVLRERGFRERMMTEIEDPNLWIAPALYSRRNFLEPMQGGALKQMGILKPWAPTRSYGLVVALDQAFLPTESLHSRTDGSHHGIRSSVEWGGRLLCASGGGDAILSPRLRSE